jgi:hypothetical protein
MKRYIITLVLAAVLALPGLAAACHVVSVDATVNCDGWTACFSVYFAGPVMDATLEYAVVVVGGDGVPLEGFADQVEISRDVTGPGTLDFCFSGLWEGYHDNPPFEVAVAGNLTGDEAVGEVFVVDCVVPIEDSSWDQIKSYYR